uniref:BMP-binding endothelial regulator protein n=1 Tax=Daphnia magna TaxID=35525 RepID=A0A0N8BFH5_9CRUS
MASSCGVVKLSIATARFSVCFISAIVLVTSLIGGGGFISRHPNCADAIQIASLTATNQNCTNEGQTVVVKIVEEFIPCMTCMCKDGHVQCKKEICPSTGNCYVVLQQNKSAAKCCQVCKGCYYRGVHYQSGSQWNDPDDPCQTMTCQGGVVTVSRQTCRWNEEDAATADGHCQHLLPARPGECCPRCKGCQWRQARNGRNVTMAEGGPAASPDPLTEPCTQCQCLPGGSMMCTRQTCPVLPCPANKALLQPGACCPVCQGVRKEVQPAMAAPAVCQIGKKQFELGAKFRPDPCTNCTCQPNSTTVCLRDNSRRLGGSSSSSSCPNVHPATITVAPPLLASWPSDAVASKSATTQPSAMAVVASFQRQQEAAAAAASSSSSSSSILSTHGKGSQPQQQQQQQQQQPAMQTPTALPASRPLTCAYRGVTYQDGAGWSLDPCTQCSCSQGEVRCAVQQCPVYRPKDHHRRKMKSSDSDSSSSPSSSSSSSSGSGNNVQSPLQAANAGQPCPPGRHPVKEAGQCCPKCVEDDAVCTVFGDPHYRTFDGRVFNFQGACKYLLTSDCRNDTFSVRVTNDARSSRSFSWTKTVTLTIEDLKVTLGQNMKVKVNHKRVSLPFVSLGVLSVVQEGYSVVVRTNLGVKLLWDGESFLEVTVPPAFKRRLCGLCGNFNGRRRDDLRMRSGQLATSVEQFGASWKVGGPKSCSSTSTSTSSSAGSSQQQRPPPSSSSSSSADRLSQRRFQQHHPNQLASSSSATASSSSAAVAGKKTITAAAPDEPLCQRQWHIRIRAVRECSVLKAATFAQCHAQVSPVRYFKSCLLDMCECPSGKQCYCEALTAYARECARHGVTQIDPKWREVTSCTGHHHTGGSTRLHPST